MLWMWLKVSPFRPQRVHVEMLESFRYAVISEVASSLASLQVAEDGGFAERLLANTAVPLDKSASRPSLEALNRSRSALGLYPPVVVVDGPIADKQAVGKTSWPEDAPSLKHGMTNMTSGTGHGSKWLVVRSRALLMTIQFANLTSAKFRRSNWVSSC